MNRAGNNGERAHITNQPPTLTANSIDPSFSPSPLSFSFSFPNIFTLNQLNLVPFELKQSFTESDVTPAHSVTIHLQNYYKDCA
jgi:hypothetical protein